MPTTEARPRVLALLRDHDNKIEATEDLTVPKMMSVEMWLRLGVGVTVSGIAQMLHILHKSGVIEIHHDSQGFMSAVSLVDTEYLREETEDLWRRLKPLDPETNLAEVTVPEAPKRSAYKKRATTKAVVARPEKKVVEPQKDPMEVELDVVLARISKRFILNKLHEIADALEQQS